MQVAQRRAWHRCPVCKSHGIKHSSIQRVVRARQLLDHSEQLWSGGMMNTISMQASQRRSWDVLNHWTLQLTWDELSLEQRAQACELSFVLERLL